MLCQPSRFFYMKDILLTRLTYAYAGRHECLIDLEVTSSTAIRMGSKHISFIISESRIVVYQLESAKAI